MSQKTHLHLPHGAVLAIALLCGGRSMVAQAAPATPDKDVLIFTNGDQLSGTLTRTIGDSVVFKSDLAGEITVPMAKVKELRTHGSFAVLQHGVPVAESKKVVPAPLVITSDQVEVEPTGAPALTIPVKNVAYVIDAKTFNDTLTHRVSFFDGWNGAVNLGTSYNQATIHGGSISTGVALVRQVPLLTFFRPRNKTMVNFQQNYGVLTTPGFVNGTTQDVQAKTNILHADVERDEYFSKTAYVLGTAAWDHNYAQSLALQQTYGGGIGWTVFNTALQQLDLKADAHYAKQEHFDPSLNLNLFGSTFGEAYRRTLPMKMSLTQTAAFIPAWNQMSAYSWNASGTLSAPIFRRLSLNLTALDSYINNPDPGYQKNSFTFTTGLSYTLR